MKNTFKRIRFRWHVETVANRPMQMTTRISRS